MANEETEPQTEPQPEKKKSPLRLIFIIVVLIVGGIYGYIKIAFALSHETTDDAQVATQITPVLPRVSGYVKTIAVNDYDSVQTGQLLLELDDADLQTELLQMEADSAAAEADIANAKAALNNAEISLGTNKGNISLSKVSVSLDSTKVQQALDDYNRNKNLYASQAITKKQLDDSKYALDQSEYTLQQAIQETKNSNSDYSTADSRIAVLNAGIAKAQAALNMKKAAIEQQQLKISYTKIYAPESGKIGKRNITEGQFVQAGSPLFSIVDDSTYWVIANFKETQIKLFHDGMPVNIELDAYPDLKLTGSLSSVSEATGAQFSLLPPDNASGNFVKVTQRIPVKININDPGKYKDKLRAGLSAYVVVPVK
jgi:membrane fusion protein (multidrug efflux system)